MRLVGASDYNQHVHCGNFAQHAFIEQEELMKCHVKLGEKHSINENIIFNIHTP